MREKLVTIISLLIALSSSAENEVKLNLNGYLQTIGLFKTDRDFDSSKPLYSPDGQTVGFFGTFFDPKVTVRLVENLSFYYEIEIGTNLWSRNRVEWNYGEVKDYFAMKHRQIYLQLEKGALKVLRVGYQYFKDPTGLFINHWLGGIYMDVDLKTFPLQFFFGQLPDSTYEGWEFDRNNFRNDIFVLYAGSTKKALSEKNLTFKYGISGLYDGEVIRKHKWILSPQVHISFSLHNFEIGGDIAIQAGRFNHTALDFSNEYHFAGGIQLYAGYGLGIGGWGEIVDGRIVPGKKPRTEFKSGWFASLLYLSPDDSGYHNKINFAFQYSGRSLSRTIMLTEDEFRDLGLNIDEKIGERASTLFTLIRSGLFIIEGSYYYKISEPLLLSAIAGAGLVLEEKNALGNYFLAGEVDLALQYRIVEGLVLDFINSLLIPGKAGSAFLNTIDKSSMRPIYQSEISLNLIF